MSARARHERQIERLDTTFGKGFDRALSRVLEDSDGLAWFADAQIADIRDEMIRADWFTHKINRENRKRRAA